MYVDIVVLNKIKIYFKTLQIHIFSSYTFLLLFEGSYAEKFDNYCSTE